MKHPQYNPALDNPPLTEAEMDELDQLLLSAGSDESVMDMESLDGYLTALLLTPTLPDADVWVPGLWNSDDPESSPFASGKQTKRVVQLALRHLASIDRQLKEGPDTLEPLFGIAEIPGSDDASDVVVDAEPWCMGFLHAAALSPDHWNAMFDEPDLADLLAPIILLGGDPDSMTPEQVEMTASSEARDALSRMVPEAVSALYARAVAARN